MDELTKRTAADAAWILNPAIRMITRCAETGIVPPARGVMVSAGEFPAGFRTVSTELLTVVCTSAQQGIQMSQLDHQYFDIRVLVQKGILGEWTISTITCRVAYEHYFNTSMCETIYDVAEILPQLFSPEKINEILHSLYQVSVKAAQEAETHMGSLGRIECGFCNRRTKKLWIIELNGKPQKKIYKDLKCFKYKKLIYSRPLEYAYYLSQS